MVKDMINGFMPVRRSNVMLLCSAALVVGCGGGGSGGNNDATPDAGGGLNLNTVTAVLETNALIAFNAYSDSVTTANELMTAAEALVATPSAETLMAARDAWLLAREPYGQTEAYRFRLGPIDSTDGVAEDGPEGRINAWPLGEALIDYVALEGTGVVDGVDEAEQFPPISPVLTSNAIADEVNFPTINVDTIATLNEADGDEANVATGYHAIEFLLWGQDLYESADLTWDGSTGADRALGGGSRPYTDYAMGDSCTSGVGVSVAEATCVRRGEYLLAAIELLISDLGGLVAEWDPAGTDNHYNDFVSGGVDSLSVIFESMGRLGFGELAGERMNIALEQDSQEDEHSCFSDNTHRDILLNEQGIANSYFGTYTNTRIYSAATEVTAADGTSLDDLLRESGFTAEADALTEAVMAAQESVGALDTRAATETFDVQIAPGNTNGNAIVTAAISALVDQTNAIEDAINALELSAGDLRQDTEENI